ncbi:lipoate-protein ligase A [Klebsiella pneumoniae]|uniref:Lipoate-protein ligase A n=1 Tax=Klebsiella pneumoniae TaxID=573 RepID=A0A378FZX7_KLEPN|nr:lipoate-protein ligase A [Klebsiella pneumoniae]
MDGIILPAEKARRRAKIVGTAQYWRPLAAGGGHVVLAHAVILIDADLSAAHQAANAFRSAARQRAGLLR